MTETQRLEYLSDNVRKGIPIDLSEAKEVIEYQLELRAKKDNSFFNRILKRLGGLRSHTEGNKTT